MMIQSFPGHGWAICGDSYTSEVLSSILPLCRPRLIISDPPYGQIVDEPWDKDGDPVNQWIRLLDCTAEQCDIGTPFYLFGGTGKPGIRPFYRFLSSVELRTDWVLADHITWAKKRAYGKSDAYLYTREEIAYLLLGTHKPNVFHKPYLLEKRTCPSMDLAHPCKSEYKRRTNVWSDVTEMFSGKIHPCEKPVKLLEIPILTHTDPGDMVLDHFGGSGATAIAAIRNSRRFLIIEKDQPTFFKMCARIQKEVDFFSAKEG